MANFFANPPISKEFWCACGPLRFHALIIFVDSMDICRPASNRHAPCIHTFIYIYVRNTPAHTLHYAPLHALSSALSHTHTTPNVHRHRQTYIKYIMDIMYNTPARILSLPPPVWQDTMRFPFFWPYATERRNRSVSIIYLFMPDAIVTYPGGRVGQKFIVPFVLCTGRTALSCISVLPIDCHGYKQHKVDYVVDRVIFIL